MSTKILNPSSAARRIACPGSFKLEALAPVEAKSLAALEGDAAHWVMKRALKGEQTKEGTQASNGEIVTEDMIEGARLFAEQVLDNVKPPINLHVEEKIHIPSIHPDCWGTPDCWHYEAYTAVAYGELYIYDYKFGHASVEAFENWQLIEYAAGILNLLGVNGVTDSLINVHLVIVQPRCYANGGPIKEWKLTARELRPYFNIAENAEAKTVTENAECAVSSQCYYCEARAFCPTLQSSALKAVDLAGESMPFNLPPDSLGSELRFLLRAKKLLDARATALQEQAIALIKEGKRVPYFELTETAGREDWAKDIEEILILEEFYNISLKKELKLITPKQAIKAGIPESIVRNYSKTINGNLKLIESDNQKIKQHFKLNN